MLMRKSIFLVAAAALVMTTAIGCDEKFDENAGVQEETVKGDFEIQAAGVITKTTCEENNVTFSVGDKVNLFHAETVEGKAYPGFVNDGCFTVVSVEGGVASLRGELGADLNAGKSYDWYALYPYDESTASPTEAKVNFKSSYTQQGNNSKAHLAGSGCPLIGEVLNVKGSDIPTVRMKQLASVMEIAIANPLDEDIVVNKIEIVTNQEKIAGAYAVDFKSTVDWDHPGDVSLYKPFVYGDESDKEYDWYKMEALGEPCKKVTLNVEGGTVIDSEEPASFYIPVAPVAFAQLGSGLTIIINDKYVTSATLRSKILYSYCNGNVEYHRHVMIPGTVKKFMVTYGLSDLASEPVVWKNEGTVASWNTSSQDPEVQAGNVSRLPATNDMFSYMWLESVATWTNTLGAVLGCANATAQTKSNKINPYAPIINTMFENDAVALRVPVRSLEAGKTVDVELCVQSSNNAPAYMSFEYSCDQGKTWTKAAVESEMAYSGPVSDANWCFTHDVMIINTAGAEAKGGSYTKAKCAITRNMENETFMFRMRAVNAAFSVVDVQNNVTAGSRVITESTSVAVNFNEQTVGEPVRMYAIDGVGLGKTIAKISVE